MNQREEKLTWCNTCDRWFHKPSGYCNWCRHAWRRFQGDPSWDALGGPPDRPWFVKEVRRRLAAGKPRYPYRKGPGMPQWKVDVLNSAPEEETHDDGPAPVELLGPPGQTPTWMRLTSNEDGTLQVTYEQA